jgi:hypothetical protein
MDFLFTTRTNQEQRVTKRVAFGGVHSIIFSLSNIAPYIGAMVDK